MRASGRCPAPSDHGGSRQLSLDPRLSRPGRGLRDIPLVGVFGVTASRLMNLRDVWPTSVTHRLLTRRHGRGGKCRPQPRAAGQTSIQLTATCRERPPLPVVTGTRRASLARARTGTERDACIARRCRACARTRRSTEEQVTVPTQTSESTAVHGKRVESHRGTLIAIPKQTA